jgi:hypothetical protein
MEEINLKRKKIKRKYYLKNKNKILLYNRKYYSSHKKDRKIKRQKYYLKHKDEEFKSHTKYYIKHKKKLLKKWKEYYLNNKIKIDKYRKKYNNEHTNDRINYKLIHNYGITLNEKQNILKQQNYKCLVCNKNLKNINTRYIHIDHNHKTKKIRGILCQTCNLALGLLKENPAIIYRLFQYVKKF